MPKPSAVAAALLLVLAGGLAACDERPREGEAKNDKGEKSGERNIGEGRTPGAKPAQPAPPQQAEAPKPGAPPEAKPGAAASVVGTWRVRVQSGTGETEGVTYTFTRDGRVTVGPEQICRYRIENEVLSIDCAGTTAQSASGRLERQNRDNLVWKVGDKTVRLERQAGVKE